VRDEVIAQHGEVMNAKSWFSIRCIILALLEQKTRALDQAAPLVGWELPGMLCRLRRLLEARLNKGGRREYVQVLRFVRDIPAGRSHASGRARLAAGNDLL